MFSDPMLSGGAGGSSVSYGSDSGVTATSNSASSTTANSIVTMTMLIPVNYVYRNPRFQQLALQQQHQSSSSYSVILPKECDHVIVLGDLNYRVDLTYEVAVALCARSDSKSLLKEDQLNRELRHPHSPWFGFADLTPTFLPTYRLDFGTIDTYDTSDKKRVPSFTDRILLWSKRQVASTATTATSDNIATSANALSFVGVSFGCLGVASQLGVCGRELRS